MGRNQYWAGRVYDMCVYYMTGTPKGSTESGFMEKPGIEPATPGLQGIALIHYTTGFHTKGSSFRMAELKDSGWVYNLGLKSHIAWLLKFNGFKKCRHNYPWNKRRRYMGIPRHCLSFSLYEQLKLHYLSNLTVDKSKLQIISHGNSWIWRKPRHKNRF